MTTPKKANVAGLIMKSLNSEEYQKVIYDWNATDSYYPKDKTICELFEAQVKHTPAAIALVYEGEELSYKELNEKSNQLARYIRTQYKSRTKKELAPDTLIALCLDRSLEMVIGILAVLKAGGAYVPMDPAYPQERIDFILEDTQAELVLAQKEFKENNHAKLPHDRIIYIDLTEKVYKKEDSSNLLQHSSVHDLAYVIYTSGTTGKPKGVMVEHKAFFQFIYNFNKYLDEKINSHQRNILSLTNYVFDIFGLEYALPLIAGDKITLSSIDDVKEEFILNNQIIQQTPSTLLHLVNTYPDKLAHAICLVGGEVLPSSIAEKLISAFHKVINVYGPAETVIWSSCCEIKGSEKIYIGKPLHNEQMYVLDPEKKPVPVGRIGELYIGGAGLARGYLNRKELTAERFVVNPFVTEIEKEKKYTRLYKTGDLVKWSSDGNLEFVGRNDDQVKIRGYRIELGEIENALSKITGIKQSCVLAKERQSDGIVSKCLVGYYVLESKAVVLSQTVILDKLSQLLPSYMIPSAFVTMESFPLTVNGKLDKRALPVPDFISLEEYIEPTNEKEKKVSKIWQDVLGVNRVGITDNFFRIGGDSMLALQVSHRMSILLKCDVKVANIFKYKNISGILAQAAGKAPTNITRTDSNQTVLSFAQERLWFIEQYEEGANAYHLPVVYELDIDTDAEGVKYALKQIVSRHEVLRSTIEQGDKQERAIQKVYDLELEIEEVTITDKEDYESLIKLDVSRVFDLSKAYPLRIKFYRIESAAKKIQKILLLINTHHIATDGWSTEIFQKELLAYYDAYINKDKNFTLPPLEIQYKDYAVWQRAYLTGETIASQLNYWKNKLGGYQPLELPTDFVRPNVIDYKGAQEGFTFGKEVSQKLRALAKSNGVTLHSVMLSSINILLSKYTGQEDIIIGSPIANRHHRQTEELIGFFVNMLVNRTLLNKSQSYEELIVQVQEEQAEAQLNQDLPFEKLVDELKVDRDMSRHPVFQVVFVVQSFNNYNKNLDQQKIHIKPYKLRDDYEQEKFDLTIFIDDSKEELTGDIRYATSLFHKDTIKRFIDHYCYLLDQLTQAPEKPYNQISLLNTEEYKKIVFDWNATDKKFSKEKTINELFEEQAKRTPNNIALVFEQQQLTYKELDEKSNQLAHSIRSKYKQRTKQSLPPGTLITLCLERSLEMVVGILAVLKAGGAYVPIDPNYPLDRVTYILEDTKTEILLCQKHLTQGSDKLPKDKIIHIELTDPLYKDEDTSGLLHYATFADLAYVIYTSGTTGKPKGAMLNHSGIVNRIEWMQSMYPLSHEDVVLQKTPYVFDVSVWELLWANWYGAKIVFAIPEGHKDSDYLHQLIQKNKVTTLHFVPSMLEAYNHYLKEQGLKFNSSIKKIFCSGEALNRNVVQQTFQNSIPESFKLHNLYGPTEASIDVTYFEASENKNVCIGRPIQNTQVYILDSNKSPVPIGVVGELYLGGAGLARGYLNRPELTEERFVFNPFASEADKIKGYTRLYKTGDLVRWLADGNIEYIGRNDDQVKIRGYRIELGEIENTLAQIKGIKQSCVLAKERHIEPESNKHTNGVNANSVEARANYIKQIYKERILEDNLSFTALNKELSAFAFSKSELEFLYKEIFQSDAYLVNTSIKNGDTIFDVGANIGISSVFFAKQADNLKIYGFEPIDKLHDVLTMNLFIHSHEASFKTFHCGLGAENQDNVAFSFFRNNTVISTQYPDLKEDSDLLLAYLSNTSESNIGSNTNQQLVDFIIDSQEEVICQIRTLSSIIKQEKIERIDLLKIDVEKAELDVFKGIEEQDWNKIHQIIVEIQDKDNRLEVIKQLLSVKGFVIKIQQEKEFQGTDIYVLHAIRKTHSPVSKSKNKETINQNNCISELLEKYKRNEKKSNGLAGETNELQTEEGSSKYLVGYYVLDGNHIPEKDSDILDSWENLYDSEYEKPIDQVEMVADFSTWNSYINGDPFPLNEMEAWRDDILAGIKKLNPCNVLEIGVGSGLLMYPLLKDVQRFTGLDISRSVINRHKEYLKGYKYNVDLYHLKADELDKLPEDRLYDTIIINSVCQYFPSIRYFEEMFEKAISRLSETGSLFLGDIRNYNLYKELIKEKLEYKGEPYTQHTIDRIALKENELLISPSYFLNLRKRYKHLRIEIFERNGSYKNELSKYRYDVVISNKADVLNSSSSSSKIAEDYSSEFFTTNAVNHHNIPFLNQLSKEDILKQLSKILPDYMVPNAMVAMESFPLTINGKLDKRALPDPDFGSSQEEYVAPTNEREAAICLIWQEVLGLDRVGITDNFFRIGGNSIFAIQASHRMSKALGCNVKVADVFKFPTCLKLVSYSNTKTIVYVEGEL